MGWTSQERLGEAEAIVTRGELSSDAIGLAVAVEGGLHAVCPVKTTAPVPKAMQRAAVAAAPGHGLTAAREREDDVEGRLA